MGYMKDQLLARLQELKIEFTCYDHPVVLTVKEQDKKHHLYVVSALDGTKVDMKILSQRLGLGKGSLQMAPEANLLQVLQIKAVFLWKYLSPNQIRHLIFGVQDLPPPTPC